MGLSFNFSDVSGVVKSKRLQPWGIYEVKFVGARVDEIQGKKDPSKTYKILKVRFEDKDQNYYEESMFYPADGDDVRREITGTNGNTSVMPSVQDIRMGMIAQLATVLNPDGYKKMQELSSKFKNFDDVTKAFITITDKVKGKVTKIKLVGRNRNGRIEPVAPRVVAINKEGDAFPADNFIGDNVAFTAYELKKKDEVHNAAPTPADSFASSASNDDNGFDYESLLN